MGTPLRAFMSGKMNSGFSHASAALAALALLALAQAVAAQPVGLEAEINQHVEGLIDGCLAPDYEGIKVFLGEEYAEEAVQAGLLTKPEDGGSRGIVKFLGWLWNNNIDEDGLLRIPYDFHPDAAFPADQVATIHKALADLGAAVGILKFVSRAVNDFEWISIESGSGCWSYIGRTGMASGGQPLNLQPNVNGYGCVHKGIVQHEFMHALGFYHEQSRPDRDDHVTINLENIQAGKESNFKTSTNIDSQGSEYDYGSVMHYGPNSFSSNGLPTIDSHGNSIGQRIGASPADVVQLRLLYQCRSEIRHLDAHLAEPCTADCKCATGMSGCAGNDDFCHVDARCDGDTCVAPGVRLAHARRLFSASPCPVAVKDYRALSCFDRSSSIAC